MKSEVANRKLTVSFFVAATATLMIIGSLLLGQQKPVPAVSSKDPLGYLTYLSTDKPIYRTGEKLYVRGVMLRADDHSPISGSQNPAFFEIKGPKGDTVASGASTIIDSIVGFSWDIPTTQAGGEYTIRVSHPSTGDAPAERKFDIRAYRAPRLKSQIVFVRDGYGPGDTVSASLHVDRAEGGVPAGARVSVSARLDGNEVWKGSTTVDSSGNANATFKLPAMIDRGEGTIAMIIEDGSTVETAAKTIPILLQTLDLALYPEGGDLVAGLSNRVYIEGKTPSHKPADMAGIITNQDGKEVAWFRTEHEGRGRFSFTPRKGETYSLHVTEPSGIKTVFPLPAVKESGVVISFTADITPRQKDVAIRIGATSDGVYSVSLGQRGKEVSFTAVKLVAGRLTDVSLTLPKSIDGVLVATVYDPQMKPMAERLVFRQPDHQLNVRVTADKPDFTPGDKVSLRIATTDERGKPAGAFVGITVTDSSILEMIDKREQAPNLPVMVMLENDVRDLADAHVYLDETNPKAPLATDLLLGTQGWRRFATIDAAKFMTANGDTARRVLGARVITEGDRASAAKLYSTFDNRANAPMFAVAGIGQGQGRGAGVVRDGLAVIPPPVPPVANVTAPQPPERPQELRVEAAVEKAELKQAAATVGEVLPDNRVRDLPLIGGDVLDLIAVMPGVVANGQLLKRAGGQAELAGGIRMLTVREYAHALRPGWTEGSRSDFAETVYWNAGVKTDSSTGLATVSFNLSDSVTSFKVLADGFASDGALGSGIAEIESVQPFFIEPKIPLQVTSGDVIQLPIGIVNGKSHDLGKVEMVPPSPVAGIQFTMPTDNSSLRARERVRRIMQIGIGREFSGMTELKLDAKAGPYRDIVNRRIDVQPLGYPYESNAGGMLEANGSYRYEFTLPAGMIPGSVSTSVVVYPTPLANMTGALQALLQQPYGCFEQTSSTSYPIVMAQQYFLTHTGVEPGIIDSARNLLEASYKRLTGFESRTRGYEWFGADPGHEALTAYGLMQFTDMTQVRDVDKEMLQRTRAWLLARRDGNGGFARSAKAVDSFGRAPEDTTNAYITWALVESGEKDLAKEIARVKAAANSSSDSYIVSLAANILNDTGDHAGSRPLMDKLTKSQDAAGNVKGGVNSITRSGGAALDIETTALAMLAWMRDPSYASNVEKAVKWIVESNKNGRFGSTQSTILALRAVVAYDAARAHPKAPGRIILTVDGKPVGASVAFTANTQGAITMPDFGKDLGAGKHAVVLKMDDGSSMPFSMNVKYFNVLPDSSDQTRIGMKVVLKDQQVAEGGVTEAMVSIANKSDEAIPTPVAIIGIPGGLEVRHDQMKELVKSGKIDAYEVSGREVILYWRFIKAKDKFDLPISLVAAVPGTYTGPTSRAYLYYTDEYKDWEPGLQVTIKPR